MSGGMEDVERLYRSHGHVVLRRARALLGNEPDAREAMQEVFASLVRDRAGLGRLESVVGWLYQATTHFCLNALRNRRTGAELLEERVAPALLRAEQPRAEAWVVARQILGRLPPELAEVVVYHHLDGMTHEEISEVLGCSRRQVGYLLERAASWAHGTEKTA